jgi:hypothetical protein
MVPIPQLTAIVAGNSPPGGMINVNELGSGPRNVWFITNVNVATVPCPPTLLTIIITAGKPEAV